MTKIHTHYDNLKVARTAPPEVIRAAYKTLSQKYHPDKNNGDPEAARIMRLLNVSFEVLINPEKRRLHDAWILAEERAAFNANQSGGDYSAGKNEPPSTDQAPDKPQMAARPHKRAPISFRRIIGLIARDRRVGFIALMGIVIWWISSLHSNTNVTLDQVPDLVKANRESLYHDEIIPAAQKTPKDISVNRSRRPPTYKQWQRIRGGMSNQEALALLGPPISVDTNSTNDVVLHYSLNSSVGPYVRIIDGKIFAWGGDLSYLHGPKNKNASRYTPQKAKASCLASGADAGFPIDSENGYVSNKPIAHQGGESSLTVDNTRVGSDALIKLVRIGDVFAARTFLVAAKSKYTIDDIAPGTYKMLYRFRGSCDSNEADQTFEFKQFRDGDGVKYSVITVTLYTVQNGNLRFKSINPNQFDAL